MAAGHAMPKWPRAGGEASTAAGPGGATLMRRQLHAEEDAAAVEGDVGCVVLLSEDGRARGALFWWAPPGGGLRVGPVGGAVWLLATSSAKMLGARHDLP
jgi:hypothetical protein